MSQSGPILQNYDELCRLCASYDAIKMDIFSDRGKERKLLDKITTCLPFQVSEDDLLPKSLCYRCIYNLESFYNFRRGCIDALARLENVIKQSLTDDLKSSSLLKPSEISNVADCEQKVCDDVHEINHGIKPEIGYEDEVESESEQEQPNPADFLELVTQPSNIRRTNLQNGEEEGPFRCETCSRLFNSRSSLTIHAKFHRERSNGEEREMGFSCYVCDKIFSSKGHLALHSRVHIGEANSGSQTSSNRSSPANIRLYQCDLCNKSYSMAKHLWGHVSTSHKGDPLVTCNICLRTFSSISNLEDHRRVKHKNNNLEQQMKNLTPEVELSEAGVECNMMDLGNGERKISTLSTLDEMSANRRKSSKPRKIERESESVQDEEETTMENEEMPEGNVDMVGLACIFCGESCEDKNALSHHLLTYHGTEAPVASLIEGGEAFMDHHFAESMMEAETVFCCEICIREFSDKASLWLHMLYSHRDEASKACGICLKICPDNDSLIQHVEMCHPRDKTEQRRYSCQVCARQHDSRKKLVTHAKIHKLTDAEGNLIDPESVVVLNSEFYASEATMNSSLDDRYLMHCEICYKGFETEAKLVKHKRSSHRDSMGPNSANSSNTYHFFFACEICGLSHSSRTDRWRHMATTHAGDPSVTCELEDCGKVFPTSAIKKDHAENHHAQQGQYPNTCEICGKMWKTRVEYWKHMMGVHSDCLPYICGVCLKVFCDMSELVSHVRNIHWPLPGGEFSCDICGRPYSKLSKMTRHRKIHNVPDNPPELKALLENPKIQTESHFLQQPSSYSCDMCEGTATEYENLEDLNKHRRTTHNVMPCDLCTKYYGRTSHLWKHVNKIHKGHPEITCQLCQRTSASRLHLANHMAKHHRSEDPNYTAHLALAKQNAAGHSCEKCSKVFRKESLMKKHAKHCKGPRPPSIPLPAPVNGVYTCEKCSKTFTVQNTLYKHMRNSHLTHGCDLCDKMVDSKTELFEHVKQEHGDHPDVKCDVKGCDKILRCKADLERHKRDHRQYIQLHICKFCAELVTSKLRMRKHLKTVHGKDTKHLCALCLKALPNFKELRTHVEENHAVALSRPNTCPVCAKPCQTKSKLLEHIKYHGSTFHPCKLCFKIFSTKEKLNDHITNHPSDSCDEEDQMEEVELDPNSIMDIIGAPKNEIIEVKRDEDDVEIILKRKCDDSLGEGDNKKIKVEFCCTTCESSFGTQSELKDHEEEVHKEKSISTNTEKCLEDSETVNDSANKNSNLKETVCKKEEPDVEKSKPPGSLLESVLSEAKKEGEESKWEAGGESDVTDKSFMHQLGLIPDGEKSVVKVKNNRKVYTDDFTPSTCEVCGKVWPAKRHLWQHLIRFHRPEAGTSCGVCLKLCADYTMLSIHLALEHPDNFEGDGTNLTCKACGKYHNARSKLQNHVSIHVGHEDRALANQHQCLQCNKAFTFFCQLCEHNKEVHNYSALYASSFRPSKPAAESQTSVKLQNEEVKASYGIKERGKGKLPFYSCDVCSLVFASEIGLTNHRRIHEHSDNFKCGQCGELFGTAEALGNHKLSRHRGTEFVCADCKSNFTSYKQLTEHNKQCKIRLKNSEREASVVDEDSEVMEVDEVVLNGSPNELSSSETDIEKTEDNIEEEEEDEEEEEEDEEEEDSDISEAEEQKSNVSIDEDLSDEQVDDEEDDEVVDDEVVEDEVVDGEVVEDEVVEGEVVDDDEGDEAEEEEEEEEEDDQMDEVEALEEDEEQIEEDEPVEEVEQVEEEEEEEEEETLEEVEQVEEDEVVEEVEQMEDDEMNSIEEFEDMVEVVEVDVDADPDIDTDSSPKVSSNTHSYSTMTGSSL